MIDCTPYLERLRAFVQARDFAGWDPYDALNSPIARWLAFGRKHPRIAWIQFLKRCPVNLRPLLRVPMGHNPKGLGLFLWGYAKLYRVDGDTEYLAKVHYMLNRLRDLRSSGYSGDCWGYNFDWQSRAFYVPKYTPTVVNSCFIGHALLDVYRYVGVAHALESACSVQRFLLNDLNRTLDGDAFCFSYTPLDRTAVHNANLLAASLLLRISTYTGETAVRDAALASLAYSMKRQRDDGAWYYADTSIQRWIDSFHTGFNLQALRYFLEAGEASEHREGYERGVQFYADNFFREDGTPKYYHDHTYPIDIHSAAQAIVFFAAEPGRRDLAQKVLEWTVKHMLDPKGYFYFQLHPRWKNRICYMRWAQAWAFHALTEYYLTNRTTNDHADDLASLGSRCGR